MRKGRGDRSAPRSPRMLRSLMARRKQTGTLHPNQVCWCSFFFISVILSFLSIFFLPFLLRKLPSLLAPLSQMLWDSYWGTVGINRQSYQGLQATLEAAALSLKHSMKSRLSLHSSQPSPLPYSKDS